MIISAPSLAWKSAKTIYIRPSSLAQDETEDLEVRTSLVQGNSLALLRLPTCSNVDLAHQIQISVHRFSKMTLITNK